MSVEGTRGVGHGAGEEDDVGGPSAFAGQHHRPRGAGEGQKQLLLPGHDVGHPPSSPGEEEAGVRLTPMLLLLTVLSCIGGFLFGYDTGVVSGAVLLIEDDLELDDVQVQLVVSITVAGALVASAVSGSLSDRYGRKPVILASSVVFCVGSVLLAIAPDFNVLVAGRLVVGLGVGAASATVPVFVSEAAPTAVRGTLVTCVNAAITFGQFSASLVDGGFSTTPHGWRWMLGLGAVPAAVQFLGLLMLPESPRWLVRQDRQRDALDALVRLRGGMGPAVLNELAEVDKGARETASEGSGTLIEALRDPPVRAALWIGASLQAAQQLSGVNSIMYYTASILRMAGFSRSDSIWLSAAVSFCNFLGSCIGLRLVETTGRRQLLLGSLALVVLLLGALGGAFYAAVAVSHDVHGEGACPGSCFGCSLDEGCGVCDGGGAQGWRCVPGDEDGARNSSACPGSAYDYQHCAADPTWPGWLILAALCGYLLVFAPGMGPMPWTICSEIFPVHVRGVCNSLTTSVNWICNFAVAMTFLTLQGAVTPHGTFALYAGLALAYWAFFYARLPETKGVPLEAVPALFQPQRGGAARRGSDEGFVAVQGAAEPPDDVEEEIR